MELWRSGGGCHRVGSPDRQRHAVRGRDVPQAAVGDDKPRAAPRRERGELADKERTVFFGGLFGCNAVEEADAVSLNVARGVDIVYEQRKAEDGRGWRSAQTDLFPWDFNGIRRTIVNTGKRAGDIGTHRICRESGGSGAMQKNGGMGAIGCGGPFEDAVPAERIACTITGETCFPGLSVIQIDGELD